MIAGYNKTNLLEIEWDLADPEQVNGSFIQISTISDLDGKGKRILSKLPMRGVDPNCLMINSGKKPTFWKICFHSNHYPRSLLKETKFAVGAIVQGIKTERTKNYKIAFKVKD